MKSNGAHQDSWRPDNFKKYLAPTLNVLYLMGIGINLSDEKKSCILVRYFKILSIIAIVISCILSIFNFLWIADLWGVDKLLTLLAISAVSYNTVITYKAICLLLANDDLQSLLKEMANMWRVNEPAKEYREKILKPVDNTYVFCKYFIYLTMSSLFIWGVQPFYYITTQYLAREANNNTYDYSKRLLVGNYPFEINTAIKYTVVLAEEFVVLNFYALSWSGCDTLFAQLTCHIVYQIDILKYDVEHLIDKETDDINFKKNLITIAIRHKDLLRLCNSVQKIFGSIIFIMMLASSMSICLNINAIKKTLILGEYGTLIIFLILFVLLILQIVIYCVFAESLTNQTSSIADAIYNSKWIEKNYRFKIYFQMFILKSQSPFYCTGFGFFRIGHVQLAQIVNGAMSYYMFLQTTS